MRVENLSKSFVSNKNNYRRLSRDIVALKALDAVSFVLEEGQTLGIVGESGCGKSTLARLLVRLENPTSGAAFYRGQNIFALTTSELREMRKHMQLIFQDPYSSLNPRMRVLDIVAEGWKVNKDVSKLADKEANVVALLERVGLNSAYVGRFPHEFSGGQRQRLGIARALAVNPDVLICDEPVSALDVSVQAQIINLLKELQKDLGLSYIFISHDLSVVRHIADEVAVMYTGKIIEMGNKKEIFDSPTHPYTQALLSSVPVPDPSLRRDGERILLSGDLPDSTRLPIGCNFQSRCWKSQNICTDVEPQLVDGSEHGHPSSCHFASRNARPHPHH